MNTRRLLLLFLLPICALPAYAIEDVGDYPVTPNIKGLTGYYLVDSVETLHRGEFRASLFANGLKDDSSSYKQGTAEVAASAGILDGLEVAATIPYIFQSGNQNGIGDIKLQGKFHINNQIGEDIPALAVAASVEFPTGDKNNGLRIVNNYGAELLLIAQTKIDIPDYTFNLVAEGGIFGQDIGQSGEEKHGRYGAAGYFPIDDDWSLIIEGTGTSSYGNSQDYILASASLRLFLKNLTLTGGIDRNFAIGQNAMTSAGLHGAVTLPF